jgi:hypothetical protein
MTKDQRAIVIRARFKLRKHTDRCSNTCRGWDVFHTGAGFEIETCDDCWSGIKAPHRLTDDEAAFLPEAIEALKAEVHAYAKMHDRQVGVKMPVVLAHELTVWQRSLGVPGLPGLTKEEREELDEELARARIYMDQHHPAGVH